MVSPSPQPAYPLINSQQLYFTHVPAAETHTCVKLVLSAAEGAVLNDVDIQRSALHLIIAVVCGPYRSNANSLVGFLINLAQIW